MTEMREWHVMEPEPWRDQAACKGYPTHWWFPDVGHAKDQATRARAICATCPVQEPCLDHSLSRMEVGIWGNTNVKERQALRRTSNAVKRLVCQECRRVFLRAAASSQGMRPYCSRVCTKRASWRRCQ